VSGQYIAQCTADPKAAATQACQDLGGLRQTMFMGDTLRGLLLYGYAFATIGTIAGYAAIVAYVGAVALLLLVGFGFWHARRASHTVAVASQPAGAHV
jgi:predicted lipid-binding transport protein (Tim44 family)